MRRVLLVFAVAAMMAALVGSSALPAFGDIDVDLPGDEFPPRGGFGGSPFDEPPRGGFGGPPFDEPPGEGDECDVDFEPAGVSETAQDDDRFVATKECPLPPTGGLALNSVLLPATVLLIGSGVLGYALLRRR